MKAGKTVTALLSLVAPVAVLSVLPGCGSSAGLQVIDVSDPENPTILGSGDTPGGACAEARTIR